MKYILVMTTLMQAPAFFTGPFWSAPAAIMEFDSKQDCMEVRALRNVMDDEVRRGFKRYMCQEKGLLL